MIRNRFWVASIRTRLLIANIGIILLGFSGITLLAAGQITLSVRSDYEASLRNTIQLIGQGLAPKVAAYRSGQITYAQLQNAFADYEKQTGGTLVVFFTGQEGASAADLSAHTIPLKGVDNFPDLEAAIRETSVVAERPNASGEDTFYTAASVFEQNEPIGLIELSVPMAVFQNLLLQRWIGLGGGFVLLTSLAVVATLWVSQSIIRPLNRLQTSAKRLSQGDLSFRINVERKDEIGEVGLAFNEMAERLQNILEEQRAFTSNASHELRTPLTNIRLRTEPLLYDAALDAQTSRQYIEDIDAEATKLTNLLQELMLLSRFEAGKTELGHDSIDIRRFMMSLYQQTSGTAQEKGIHLTITVPDEPLLIYASIGHLTVVFRNLLDNALKYTPKDGTIHWTLKPVNNGVEVALMDSGQGIAAQHLSHIYERFYRADKARAKGIPGTGLGLSLVRSLVIVYGGQITISSEGIDKGTTATVFWPYNPPTDSALIPH